MNCCQFRTELVVFPSNLIKANIIGAESGVFTDLAVGFEPKEKAKLEELKKEKVARTAALEEAEKGLVTLQQYQLGGARLSPKHEETYQRVSSIRDALRTRLEELSDDIKELQEVLSQSDSPQIEARVIHANVRVRIKDLTYLNQSEVSHPLFCIEDGQIQAKTSST